MKLKDIEDNKSSTSSTPTQNNDNDSDDNKCENDIIISLNNTQTCNSCDDNRNKMQSNANNSDIKLEHNELDDDSGCSTSCCDNNGHGKLFNKVGNCDVEDADDEDDDGEPESSYEDDDIFGAFESKMAPHE